MNLINGIVNVFTPLNLFYCFSGCVLGTLVGVLPGLGTSSTLSILLPLTMYLDPTGSIIMLAGIYYGAQYGGSTTSILVNIPGEAGSIPTCFDGFQMTRQGRAGEALWISAVGSFIAGTLGILGLCFLGSGFAKYALKFGPPEYFGLLIFGMTAVISLSGTSIMRGLIAGILGMMLATVGIDVFTGAKRFNFGLVALTRGFELVPIIVGLFGIGEIFANAEAGVVKIFAGQLGKMRPNRIELKKSLRSIVRGTVIGFPLGLLPGLVTSITSFLVYDIEKRVSKYPEKFGTGVIEGVASVEAANNATAQAQFIPLMAFGIPTTPSMAIILTALMLYGLQPGPVLFQQNTLFIWTVIGSMYIGNVILLILNLPLVRLWARISLIPYKYLGPIILAVCVVGAYSPRNTLFDVWIALGAGVIGYIMRKTDWPIAPVILGFILGDMLEQALRQSLAMGGLIIFLHRPIPIIFLSAAIAITILSIKYVRLVPKIQ